MSIRTKIAKWLAPELVSWEKTAQKWEDSTYKWVSLATMFEKRLAHRERALRNIIALRTPSCANVGRRMADIAEAALSHPNLPTREEG
jgi:hypothetical protein